MKNWTSKKRYETLLNNGLDWYLVDYTDGKTKLVHASSLSAVLECGHAPAKYGIARMQKCWNGVPCGEEGEV